MHAGVQPEVVSLFEGFEAVWMWTRVVRPRRRCRHCRRFRRGPYIFLRVCDGFYRLDGAHEGGYGELLIGEDPEQLDEFAHFTERIPDAGWGRRCQVRDFGYKQGMKTELEGREEGTVDCVVLERLQRRLGHISNVSHWQLSFSRRF